MPAPQLFSSDQQLRMVAVPDAAAARSALTSLLQWYWQGQQRPLLMLPRSSFALACGSTTEAAVKDANKAWDGGDFSPYPSECNDAYLQLLTRGLEGSPLQHPKFPVLARQWFGPALQAAGWPA
jgi:exonuclease V gamma subunit